MTNRGVLPDGVVETSTRITASRIGNDGVVSFTHDHCVDAMESTDKSSYEYYYEYDIYGFSDGAVTLVARSYSHEPDEAHFLRLETEGRIESITKAFLASALAQTAIRHLRSIGKRDLRWLDVASEGDAYVSIPAGTVRWSGTRGRQLR